MPAVILAAGLITTFWGYNRRAYHDVISSTPTSRVLDVDEPGVVELSGTVRADETMRAPLSNTECVATGWAVEEWDETGNNSHWRTVSEGYDSVTFRLDDGSAEIRVDLGRNADSQDGPDFDIDTGELDHSVALDDVTVDFQRFDAEYQLEPDAPTPDAVERFERETPRVGQQSESMSDLLDWGRKHGERKYEEGTVQPGDDVSLLGTAESADGDAGTRTRLRPEDAVVTPAGEERFILSTRSEEELLSATGWGTPAMAAGVALVLLGLYLLSARLALL